MCGVLCWRYNSRIRAYLEKVDRPSSDAIVEVYNMMLGGWETQLAEMYEQSPVVGIILFLVFSTVLMTAVMNIFLSVVMIHHQEVLKQKVSEEEEKEETKEPQIVKVKKTLLEANSSFDDDRRFEHSEAKKRITMSNPWGREQFIEESIHENDEMQRHIHDKQIAHKEKLAKRKFDREERARQHIFLQPRPNC